MWRCHCGETNLNSAHHCRECTGARVTHEDTEREPRPRERRKTVNVGFFGMGMGDDRPTPVVRRPMSEHELDSYYRRSNRQIQIMWFVYALAAAAVVGLFVWQVMRPD